jgi:hypothetical protein
MGLPEVTALFGLGVSPLLLGRTIYFVLVSEIVICAQLAEIGALIMTETRKILLHFPYQ